MRAAWWWVPDYRASPPWLSWPIEAQGAYRNLRDSLWLFDGLLPGDESTLAREANAGEKWPAIRDLVLSEFTKVEGGYRHAEHEKVARESKRKARNQRDMRAKRDRLTLGKRHRGGGDITGNVAGESPRSLVSAILGSGSGRANPDPYAETGPERTGWLEGIGGEPGPKPAPDGHDPRTCQDPMCCLDAWNRARDRKANLA